MKRDYNKAIENFLLESESHPSDELLQLGDEYKKMFGTPVPREMLPITISDKQLIDALKKCISDHNSNIFAVLNIIVNDKVIY